MSVRSFYGRYATLVDALATLPTVDRWRKAAVSSLGLTAGETVVDIGCGTGANLPFLRDRVGASGRVIGVDLTRPLLERARRRIARAGWTNVHLVHGDAIHPPVVAADAVIATFVVGLLPDPARAIETWCDHVEPGGGIAILEASRSDRLGPGNRPFDWFVRLTAPGRGAGAGAALDDRVAQAQAAVSARTDRRHHETFALGLVDLYAGRVREVTSN